MYPNLEAELKRRKIRRVDLAHSLNLALSTVVEKLSGKSDISLSLALQIKQWKKTVSIPMMLTGCCPSTK